MEGNFFSAVKASELMWNLIPGSQLVVHLEKRKQSLWPKFLQSEKEPTQLTNRIDAYQELSESDKMAVEYAMKKSTIKEQEDAKLKNLLKTAWNQEGSPFQGTQYDPSIVDNIK